MKEAKRYTKALLPYAVLMALIIALAFYAIGVVDRHRVLNYAQSRFDTLEAIISESEKEQTLILDEMCDSYLTSARVAAMMLQSSPDILENELDLEKLRVALDCTILSVSDETGEIVYSTAQTKNGQYINDTFLSGMTNHGYSDLVMQKESGTILVGAARLDQDGIVQLTFEPDHLQKMLKKADISETTKNSAFCEEGMIAVLDSDFIYLSHTDSALTGTPANFPADRFDEEADQFTMRVNGIRSRVHYRQYNDYTLLCIIPTSVLYDRRDSTTLWLLLLGAVFLSLTALRIHNRITVASHTEEKSTDF